MDIKNDLLKETELLISNNLENLSNMSIYNIKNHKRFSDIKNLYRLLNRDKTEFEDLIKEKEIFILKELQSLLDDYNMPVTTEFECSSNIAFYYKTKKIGRLNIYDASLNVFPTSIRKEYEKTEIKVSIKGLIFKFPKVNKETYTDKNSLYTYYKKLDKDIDNLNDKLNKLNEKKTEYLAEQSRIKNNDLKDYNLLDKLTCFIHRKQWVNMYELLIEEIDNDIAELNKFIEFIKNIHTSDNEYIEIMSIKNGLEDMLIKELGIEGK